MRDEKEAKSTKKAEWVIFGEVGGECDRKT